jgi:small-conductance mechanosensitive channel
MERIIETVIRSLQELLASTIKILPAILIALVIIMLTRYVAQLMRGIADKLGKRTLKSSSLQLLLVQTAHVATWVVGVLLACVVAFPGLRLGDIIATLGLGSVAIGFAFQDIFKNFLAGILLLIQEPFHIHDQIIVGNYEGTVEGIDLRTTKIRTYNDERVLVPNSEIFTNPVQVRTAFDSRRTDLAVGVDYNTSLPEAKEILHNTLAKVDQVLDHPTPEVDLVGFGDSSIDFIVRYWTTPRQVEVRQVQTEVILTIKQAFDTAGINIPYPIRSLYFYNQDNYHDNLPSKSETNNNDGKNNSYSVGQI